MLMIKFPPFFQFSSLKKFPAYLKRHSFVTSKTKLIQSDVNPIEKNSKVIYKKKFPFCYWCEFTPQTKHSFILHHFFECRVFGILKSIYHLYSLRIMEKLLSQFLILDDTLTHTQKREKKCAEILCKFDDVLVRSFVKREKDENFIHSRWQFSGVFFTVRHQHKQILCKLRFKKIFLDLLLHYSLFFGVECGCNFNIIKCLGRERI